MSYDSWKLATPPYWDAPDSWDGRICKECDWFCDVRDKNSTVCIQDAIENDSSHVDEVKPTDAACECFKEIA